MRRAEMPASTRMRTPPPQTRAAFPSEPLAKVWMVIKCQTSLVISWE